MTEEQFTQLMEILKFIKNTLVDIENELQSANKSLSDLQYNTARLRK
jgi:hypothetical protein